MRTVFGNTIVIISLLLLTACEKETTLSTKLQIEETDISVSSREQSVKLKISYAGEAVVATDASWLAADIYNIQDSSQLIISIQENFDIDKDRNGIVTVIAGSEKASVTVRQSRKGTVALTTRNEYEVSSEPTDITVTFKHNKGFNVIIPDNAKNWIECKSTRAMSDGKVILSVSKNNEYYRRTAMVFIESEESGDCDTVKIIQDEGFKSLRKLIRDNAECTLFYQALVATHMIDSITKYVDDSYPAPANDSTLSYFMENRKTGILRYTQYESDYGLFPSERLFKYTVFLATDSILSMRLGINTFDDLKQFAEMVYPGNPDSFDDMTSRENSLNKFISYHMLPEWIDYYNLNISTNEIITNYHGWENQDVEDFYETMMPHSIIRVSTPYKSDNVYLNRKGIDNTDGFIPGIPILRASNDNTALNGGFYYVDDVLIYNEFTRNQVFNTRMRYMAQTLSPDFFNSGAARRFGGNGESNATDERYIVGFKNGYCTNFSWLEGTEFWVRYLDSGFGVYMGSDIIIRSNSDLSIKLPPVPFDGKYEIRYFINTMASAGTVGGRAVAQFYFRESGESGNWIACGESHDLSIAGNDPTIGNMTDADITQNVSGEEAKQLAIQANEKAMHNRGYMKAPASYYGGSKILRDDVDCLRIILCQEQMSSNKDYYLRIQKVGGDLDKVIPFCFLEIVPLEFALSGKENKY